MLVWMLNKPPLIWIATESQLLCELLRLAQRVKSKSLENKKKWLSYRKMKGQEWPNQKWHLNSKSVVIWIIWQIRNAFANNCEQDWRQDKSYFTVKKKKKSLKSIFAVFIHIRLWVGNYIFLNIKSFFFLTALDWRSSVCNKVVFASSHLLVHIFGRQLFYIRFINFTAL